MSRLIDDFIITNLSNQVEIRGKWYIAKPVEYPTIISRLKDCIKILRNKAIAVHYKEDEL